MPLVLWVDRQAPFSHRWRGVAGDHEFEALGFEDCCDGFAHLEVHLPCDAAPSPWRIVSSGETDCLLCGAVLSAECSATDNSGQDAMGTSGRDGTGR